MTVFYVRSTDGNDQDDGSTWALAKATLASGLAVSRPGDRVWVSQNHAETQATELTLIPSGTVVGGPVEVWCGNDAAEPPTALASGATITTTSANHIRLRGLWHAYGLEFHGGTGGTQSNIFWRDNPGAAVGSQLWQNCAFRLFNTGNLGRFLPGNGFGDGQDIRFENCEFEVSHAGQLWYGGGARMHFVNCSYAGLSPNNFWSPWKNAGSFRADLRGCDFTNLGSRLVNAGGFTPALMHFENCEVPGGSFTLGTQANQLGSHTQRFVNVDSASTNYIYEIQYPEGTISSETTIVRTGGATDGTTPVSRKMTTDTEAHFHMPLISDPMVIWNEVTGKSLTVTVECIADLSYTADDDEFWIDVEYLGTSGSTQSSFADDRMTDMLATPTAQESSSVDWTTTGLTTPTKWKCSTSITPQEKGPIIVKMYGQRKGTPTNIYFCPKVDIS